jgi:hypothetical protein
MKDRGEDIFPREIINDEPVFDINVEGSAGFDYGQMRRNLLESFVEFNNLDVLVIFGFAYGRELYPFAKKMQEEKPSLKIIGADLNYDAIKKSKEYPLGNSDFLVINMERSADVKELLEKYQSLGKIGVYFCETGAYILPWKMKSFYRVLGKNPAVKCIQILEPFFIDWDINYKTKWNVGSCFSYQRGYWRHNYHELASKYFNVYETKFLDPRLRGYKDRKNLPEHDNQPMWLVSANR